MTDVAILFGNPMSGACRKVRVAAALRSVALEHITVPRNSDDPAFRRTSPTGIAPALQHGEERVLGVLAIIQYLDLLSGELPLIPAAERERVRQFSVSQLADGPLAHLASIILQNRVMMPRFRGMPGNPRVVKQVVSKGLPKVLGHLEASLSYDAHAAAFSLSEIGIFCHILSIILCDVDFAWQDYPQIQALVGRFLSKPAVMDVIERDLHLCGGDQALLRPFRVAPFVAGGLDDRMPANGG